MNNTVHSQGSVSGDAKLLRVSHHSATMTVKIERAENFRLPVTMKTRSSVTFPSRCSNTPPVLCNQTREFTHCYCYIHLCSYIIFVPHAPDGVKYVDGGRSGSGSVASFECSRCHRLR